MQILLTRAYEKPATSDGFRVLVDRLWPRGVKKADLHLDVWAKDLAPSSSLRQWFGHEEKRWDEFRARYKHELAGPAVRQVIKRIIDEGEGGTGDNPRLCGARHRAHVLLSAFYIRR